MLKKATSLIATGLSNGGTNSHKLMLLSKLFIRIFPGRLFLKRVLPRTITTGLATPSHFLPPPEEKKIAGDKITDEKSVAVSSSSSKTKKSKKKKKGPSKNDMRMFQQFLKTFKEENKTEDSKDEEKSDSSSSSSDGATLRGKNHDVFGHDPLCSQDSIPGIEDIPDLDY